MCHRRGAGAVQSLDQRLADLAQRFHLTIGAFRVGTAPGVVQGGLRGGDAFRQGHDLGSAAADVLLQQSN